LIRKVVFTKEGRVNTIGPGDIPYKVVRKYQLKVGRIFKADASLLRVEFTFDIEHDINYKGERL
jgi:hypothetical protein